MDKKINVTSNRKAGRKTQIMMDNFSDIAGVANEKHLNQIGNTDKKKISVLELSMAVDALVLKSNSMPAGKKLQKILFKLENVSEALHEYIEEKF